MNVKELIEHLSSCEQGDVVFIEYDGFLRRLEACAKYPGAIILFQDKHDKESYNYDDYVAAELKDEVTGS